MILSNENILQNKIHLGEKKNNNNNKEIKISR